jgi:hypothetical protein
LDHILHRGIRKIVPARHAVLVVLASAVLLAGIYLLHAVNETPTVSAAVPPRHDSTPVSDESTPASSPHLTPRASQQPAPEIAGDPAPGDDFDVTSGSAANPKLDAIMDQANKAYDRGEYEDAKAIAGKVLAKLPKTVRMLRIMVSSACFEGDSALAQEWYAQLPKPDRLQMKQRCDRNGVTLTEPAQ